MAQRVANSTLSYMNFMTDADRMLEKETSLQICRASVRLGTKSAATHTLRGGAIHTVVLGELAHYSRNGKACDEDVYYAVSTALAPFSPKDSRGNVIGHLESKLVCLSTPLYKKGMFYKLFQAGWGPTQHPLGSVCLQIPTWEMNPTIPASFFQEQHAAYEKGDWGADTFRREYGAEFVDPPKSPEGKHCCPQCGHRFS